MIVRIMGEGQREVPDGEADALNALDDRLETAVHGGDEAAFSAAFGALLDKVRDCGKPLPDSSLASSDVVLPPAGASLADVEALLAPDGLIPG